MKQIFTAFLLLLHIQLSAQCPSTGYVWLQNQSDVDNYFANGGCTVVENLQISGDITNLNGLSGLTTITGDLEIALSNLSNLVGLESLTTIGNQLYVEENQMMKNFEGLNNVTTIPYINIINNRAENFVGMEGLTNVGNLSISQSDITNFRGLENLQIVTGSLGCYQCHNLKELEGLDNLTGAGTLYLQDCNSLENLDGAKSLKSLGSLNIRENPELTSLSGLEALTTANTITINSNPKLTSIAALQNVEGPVTNLGISANALLSNCALEFICAKVSESSPGASLAILGNSGDCEDLDAVSLACTNLPVTLESFEAIPEVEVVSLAWKTSAETSSEGFEIQHSADGKKWSLIGYLKSSPGNHVGSEYAFKHVLPAAGDNYYRLKMIDLDQSFAFSQISHVYFASEKEAIYPNPSNNFINITSLDWSQVSTIQIHNARGNIIFKESGAQRRSLDLTAYPSGSYVLKVLKNDFTVSNYKFIVSR